jgi:hypothetical protein
MVFKARVVPRGASTIDQGIIGQHAHLIDAL